MPSTKCGHTCIKAQFEFEEHDPKSFCKRPCEPYQGLLPNYASYGFLGTYDQFSPTLSSFFSLAMLSFLSDTSPSIFSLTSLSLFSPTSPSIGSSSSSSMSISKGVELLFGLSLNFPR